MQENSRTAHNLSSLDTRFVEETYTDFVDHDPALSRHHFACHHHARQLRLTKYSTNLKGRDRTRMKKRNTRLTSFPFSALADQLLSFRCRPRVNPSTLMLLVTAPDPWEQVALPNAQLARLGNLAAITEASP